jgi:hypothetical protein
VSVGGVAGFGLRRSRKPVALVIALVALAIAPPTVRAATNRAEYAAQVNPICVSANARADELSRQTSQELKRLDRKLKRATGSQRRRLLARRENLSLSLPGRRLKIFSAELGQLRSVPAAPGDEVLVSSWLDTRQMILDLSAQINRIDRRVAHLLERFTTRSIRELNRLERKIRVLDKRAGQLNNRLISLESQDDDLGTELGATSCTVEAGGPP